MKPVNVNAFGIIGDMVAGGVVAFGAACYRSAASTIKGSLCTGTLYNMLGIADLDMVEKTIDGFYSQYDPVPLITAGQSRVWVTPNHTTAADIIAGDYLDIADLGSSNTLPVGVFEESGTKAGQTKVATSLARALEDADLLDAEVVAADVAVGATTVTMTASGLIDDLAAGDYILLEDITAEVEINRVKSVDSGTQITLVKAATASLVNGDSDLVHKLAQCEVQLL
jgi:hypothetical protein